jgi:hypothetical protein
MQKYFHLKILINTKFKTFLSDNLEIPFLKKRLYFWGK